MHAFFSICKEEKVLPPTCSLLLLPSARHSWTITYRFPTSAANTWERISAPGAPPSLGGALPCYLTAEAGPFRAVIGAAGKGGGHRRETRVSHWIGGMPLSPQTRACCGLRFAAKPNRKGSLQSLAPNPAAPGSGTPKRRETGLMTSHLRPPRGREGPGITRQPALSRASLKGPSALGDWTRGNIRSSALIEKHELQYRIIENTEIHTLK